MIVTYHLTLPENKNIYKLFSFLEHLLTFGILFNLTFLFNKIIANTSVGVPETLGHYKTASQPLEIGSINMCPDIFYLQS